MLPIFPSVRGRREVGIMDYLTLILIIIILYYIDNITNNKK